MLSSRIRELNARLTRVSEYEMTDLNPPHTRQRLSSDKRREQLIDVAYRILTESGPEGMQISEVALRAGVSRPLVYRFFKNRTELLVAVLDDFERSLSARFRELLSDGTEMTDARSIAKLFVQAACDLIEERGGGAWDLLMSRSTDPEVVDFSKAVVQRLMAPWVQMLAQFLGNSIVPAQVVSSMLVAAGDTALYHWVRGEISREVAVDACVAAITGILMSFVNQQNRG